MASCTPRVRSNSWPVARDAWWSPIWVEQVSRYTTLMIVSIKHKGLRHLYEQGQRHGVRATVLPRVEELLAVLDAAERFEDMDFPGYRLHALAGDLHDFWSMQVDGNQRIVFRLEHGGASDIDLITGL